MSRDIVNFTRLQETLRLSDDEFLACLQYGTIVQSGDDYYLQDDIDIDRGIMTHAQVASLLRMESECIDALVDQQIIDRSQLAPNLYRYPSHLVAMYYYEHVQPVPITHHELNKP